MDWIYWKGRRAFVQYGGPLDHQYGLGAISLDRWLEDAESPEEAAERLALLDYAEEAIVSGGPVERVGLEFAPEWALKPRSIWRDRSVAYDFRVDGPMFIFKENQGGRTCTVTFAPNEISNRTIYSQWSYAADQSAKVVA